MKSFGSSGFSLTEIMIGTVIGSILIMAAFTLLRSQVRNQTEQVEVSQVLRTGQRVKQLISADIEQAGFNPRNPTATFAPATTASDDHLVLQGDYNLSGTIGDQTATQPAESVDYQFNASSGVVTRNSQTIMKDVGTFQIKYYNNSGTDFSPTSSSYSQIRRIRITWTVAKGRNNSTSESVEGYLRNFH